MLCNGQRAEPIERRQAMVRKNDGRSKSLQFPQKSILRIYSFEGTIESTLFEGMFGQRRVMRLVLNHQNSQFCLNKPELYLNNRPCDTLVPLNNSLNGGELQIRNSKSQEKWQHPGKAKPSWNLFGLGFEPGISSRSKL